ncbi:hypothetical protein COB11_00965 [Candidatus Aerophobetes bacterium]|uniref:Uncharacterized protein n=1 Tax=Aerophobetes bacterium TaxID=2030807 RepID=A0A2A4YM06_UNCAE|nr:MAG: hypothetical protein COB11_00965 [Candidatus Aerophobetes bacterium]
MSYPDEIAPEAYITRDHFRKVASYPGFVNEKNIVYVTNHLVTLFFQKYYDKMSHPYPYHSRFIHRLSRFSLYKCFKNVSYCKINFNLSYEEYLKELWVLTAIESEKLYI